MQQLSDRDRAHLLSSKTGGISCWLDTPSMSDKRLNLAQDVFLHAVKNRLLLRLAPTTVIETDDVFCNLCNLALAVCDSRHHAHECRETSCYRTRRHNAVRDILAAYFRQMVPADNVQIEETLPSTRRQGESIRADIRVAVGGTVFLCDVVIGAPTTQAALANGSATIAGATCQLHVDKKFLFYKNHFEDDVVDNTVIPLAFESTGRPGKTTLNFMRMLSIRAEDNNNNNNNNNNRVSPLNYTLRLISAAIQRFNGDAASTVQANLSFRGHPPAQLPPPADAFNAQQNATATEELLHRLDIA